MTEKKLISLGLTVRVARCALKCNYDINCLFQCDCRRLWQRRDPSKAKFTFGLTAMLTHQSLLRCPKLLSEVSGTWTGTPAAGGFLIPYCAWALSFVARKTVPVCFSGFYVAFGLSIVMHSRKFCYANPGTFNRADCINDLWLPNIQFAHPAFFYRNFSISRVEVKTNFHSDFSSLSTSSGVADDSCSVITVWYLWDYRAETERWKQRMTRLKAVEMENDLEDFPVNALRLIDCLKVISVKLHSNLVSMVRVFDRN